MDCRTTPTHKFKARLGWKRYHIVLKTKKKKLLVLTRKMSLLEVENIQALYNVLSYKLAIEIDDKIKRQRAIEQELDCKFIRIGRKLWYF